MGNNKYTFWKLLDENSIEIPIIQRDYAQGRAEESRIRDKFLDVLHDTIKDVDKTVNLDFIYGRIIDRKLIPLDGQQRLTTLFLLHWYLTVKDDKLDNSVAQKLQKFTYETRISSREFCKALSTNKIDLLHINNFNDEKDRKLSKLIEDKNWFFKSWKKDPTIKSILNMLDAIHERFKNSNGLFDKLICDDKPPITFDFLLLNDFNLSDELYIKMNARGKPLTEFENFKSNFVELLDHESATKLDNGWTDLFWRFKGDKPNEDGYYYIDDKFLNFFTNFIINLGLTSDKLTEKKDLKDIYIMDEYKNILAEENSENLESLISILNTFSCLEKDKIPKYFEKFIEKVPTVWDRAKFHSLSMYVIKNQDKIDFESTKYKNWERITKNIIDNFNIDSTKKLQDTLKLISTMSEYIDNLYDYLASDDFLPKDKQSMGHRSLEFQQKEEQLKAKLIIDNPDWENVICDTEQKTRDSYLDGHIGFLIEMAGKEIEKFKQYFERFKEIFIEDKEKFLFHRALLSKGDYLIGEMSVWKNRTFCSFEMSQRAKDDNWKQVFHYKREILKALLDDKRNLLEIIENFKEENDWRYGFIKYSDVLQYCKKHQIRMTSDKEILLLSKERTSGKHAEYYTYWLYLELLKMFSKIQIDYKDKNPVEPNKYISIDGDKVKIIYCKNGDVWQYKKETTGVYEYFEDKNYLINKLI